MFYTALTIVMLQAAHVPSELKSWVPWVTHGEKHLECPVAYNNGQTHFCLLSEDLNLNLNDRGGRFRVDVKAYHRTQLLLPHSEKGWPQSLQVDNRPFPVTEIQGKPYAVLEKGDWSLSGLLAWESLPHSLVIDTRIPALNLKVNGKTVAEPNRKQHGKLWLSEPRQKRESEDQVFMNVFRLWKDGNPVELTTEIQVSVSGKVQNWKLPIPMPESFYLTAIHTGLPYQQNGDELNFQLRPGEWVITLKGLSAKHLTSVTWPEMDPPWPGQEILSFISEPSIRQVELKGLQSMDPSQLPIPEGWTRYPCYLLDREMELVERMRGASVSNIPDVYLQRHIWLDFDGEGYSFSDTLNGDLPRATFFSLSDPFKMGSSKVDGKNVLITTNSHEESGVEVRKKSFRMTMESRIEDKQFTLPATGWNTTIKQTKGTLNLPPGWLLFHASGPLDFYSTWLKKWNLYDFFILLLLCFTFGKLWSRKTGLLAAVCLFLCFQEPDIPPFFWVTLAILTALAVYLPHGKMRSLVKWLRTLNLVVLVFVVFAFSASHLRYGLYPHLEPTSYGGSSYYSMPKTGPVTNANVMTEELASLEEDALAQQEQAALPQKSQKLNLISRSKQVKKIRKIDSSEAVQTGFGLPDWPKSSQLGFSSSSPISSSQTIRLWLLSPRMKLIFVIVQIVLLASLLWKLWNQPERKKNASRKSEQGTVDPQFSTSAVSTVVVFLGLLFWGGSGYGQFPSQDLLNQLKERVLEQPDCLPYCSQVQSLEMNLSDSDIRISLMVHSDADVTVPLPGAFNEWSPESVQRGGEDVPLFLSSDGFLWAAVRKGLNPFSLTGKIAPGSSFSISFPLKVHNLRIKASGWTYETPESSENKSFVRFYRIHSEENASAMQSEDQLAPFFSVNRLVEMDQKWTARTMITRRGDSNVSLLLEIPLLSGEAVTTRGVQVKDQVALVQFPGHLRSVQWDSALIIQEQMKLQAMTQNWFSETWTFVPSRLWQIQYEGIAPVAYFDSKGTWAPSWRPWPGESIVISSLRPSASPGRTSTVDRATLEVQLGKTLRECELSVHLNSSKGMTKELTLPQGVRVSEVQVDSKPIPFKPEKNTVEIPLNPGDHNIQIAWEESAKLGMLYSSPVVDLGEPSLNNRVIVQVPRNRWVFWVNGPSQGPVLLFWSHVLFFLLVSFFLAKIPWIPLKFHQWFLLSLGLDQVHIGVAFFIYFWIMVLAFKGHRESATKAWSHNLGQIGLGFLTFVAVIWFFESIRHGLLGSPEMGITGNGSYQYYLAWYLERPELPVTGIYSLPLWIYRAVMLIWALWLARFLTVKAHWAWSCFEKGTLWRKGRLKLDQPMQRRQSVQTEIISKE